MMVPQFSIVVRRMVRYPTLIFFLPKIRDVHDRNPVFIFANKEKVVVIFYSTFMNSVAQKV